MLQKITILIPFDFPKNRYFDLDPDNRHITNLNNY